MTKPLPIDPEQPTEERLTPRRVVAAYAVHVLTASGIIFLFLAAMELAREEPSPVRVFLWLIVATIVDSIDGPLARRLHVKRFAPSIDGRAIDDIVDYIGFTFIPLLLVWRMDWVPGEAELGWLWIAPPLVASLFGFANLEAKDEARGLFRGFPSYWNILAVYLGLLPAYFGAAGPWVGGGLLLFFAGLTVAPVWFIYPNLARHPWRLPVLGGAVAWLILLLAMLPFYPDRVPGWLTLASLIYPVFYILASIHLRRTGQDGSSRLAAPHAEADGG